MVAEKNPFAVLGFAPSAFHGLSEEDIRELVKAQHRVLNMVCHPDRKIGDKQAEQKFKDVQEAMKKLSEDFEFDFWKKNFLKPRKNQIAEATEEKKTADEIAKFYHRGLLDFWRAFCQGRQMIEWDSFWGKSMKELGGWKGFYVFDPPLINCLMLERVRVAKMRLVSKHVESPLEYGMPDGDGVLRYPDGSPQTLDDIFELRITQGGNVQRRPLVRTLFNAHEAWRPNVQKELITFNRQRPAKSYYYKPEGDWVAIGGKLIGSIRNEFLSNMKSISATSAAAAAITTDVDLDVLAIVESGYTLSQFEPYFRFIRPVVQSHDYAILLEGKDENDFRFKVLGYPIRIYPPEENK